MPEGVAKDFIALIIKNQPRLSGYPSSSSFSRIISATVFIALFSEFERLRNSFNRLPFNLKLNGSRLSSDSGRPAFFLTMS